ncbi:MAG: phage integrase SAM-like domain and Arm DNA-binding domain-containing protein [Chitinophagaceae bacterium]
MKTKSNTFGVIFYLRKYKVNDGEMPIYARITVNGRRTDISVKRSVEQKNWNNNKGMAKGKNYHTTQKYIQKFMKEQLKTTDIDLSELTYRFITDFEHFLRKHQPTDHQKQLGNNGLMKHLERFKKMINLAVKLEWMEKNPVAKVSIKVSESRKRLFNGRRVI